MMEYEAPRNTNELIEERNDFVSLMEHPGWKRLVAITTEYVEGLTPFVLSPSMAVDDMVSKEHPKGQIEGCTKLLAIPAAKVEENNALLDQRRKENEDVEEEE